MDKGMDGICLVCAIRIDEGIRPDLRDHLQELQTIPRGIQCSKHAQEGFRLAYGV